MGILVIIKTSIFTVIFFSAISAKILMQQSKNIKVKTKFVIYFMNKTIFFSKAVSSIIFYRG